MSSSSQKGKRSDGKLDVEYWVEELVVELETM